MGWQLADGSRDEYWCRHPSHLPTAISHPNSQLPTANSLTAWQSAVGMAAGRGQMAVGMAVGSRQMAVGMAVGRWQSERILVPPSVPFPNCHLPSQLPTANCQLPNSLAVGSRDGSRQMAMEIDRTTAGSRLPSLLPSAYSRVPYFTVFPHLLQMAPPSGKLWMLWEPHLGQVSGSTCAPCFSASRNSPRDDEPLFCA